MSHALTFLLPTVRGAIDFTDTDPHAGIRYPVEKERPLDAAVFLRFAACGAVCGSTAHGFLIPIDVVKTRMQSEPKKYPDMTSTFGTLVKEEVGGAG